METSAEYSIDGKTYATCYYDKGDKVARDEGYFGFELYQKTEEKVIDSVKYSSLSEVQAHYVSYKNAPDNFKLDNG